MIGWIRTPNNTNIGRSPRSLRCIVILVAINILEFGNAYNHQKILIRLEFYFA